MSEPVPVWYTTELLATRDDLIRQLRRVEDILIQAGQLSERSLLNREERRALQKLIAMQAVNVDI